MNAALAASLRASAATLRAEADRLEAFAAAAEQPPATCIVTTDTCSETFPGLTSRAFADAGRAGAFSCFKAGRKLAAKREDVERWLESRRVRPRSRKAASADVDQAYAELAGAAR